MPNNPAFKATRAEWRTVMAAIVRYKEFLGEGAPKIEGEDDKLIAYDHIERLDRLIPSFERQLDEYVQSLT